MGIMQRKKKEEARRVEMKADEDYPMDEEYYEEEEEAAKPKRRYPRMPNPRPKVEEEVSPIDKDEMLDVVEGHLVRAAELLRYYRGIK